MKEGSDRGGKLRIISVTNVLSPLVFALLSFIYCHSSFERQNGKSVMKNVKVHRFPLSLRKMFAETCYYLYFFLTRELFRCGLIPECSIQIILCRI